MKVKACFAACVAAAILFCGCGKGGSGTSQKADGKEETAAAEDESGLTAAVILGCVKVEGLSGEMDTTALHGSDMFNSTCENLYGKDASKFTDGGIMFVGAGTLADELSVLRGKDTESLMKLLRKRAERRAKDYEGYAPAEKDKADSALVFEHKGFAVLVISDRAEEIKEKILSL